MRKNICLLLFILGIAGVSFSQIRIVCATNHKIVAGMGGVVMHYTIEFREMKNMSVTVDSIKTRADGTLLSFQFIQHEPCCNEITFLTVLLPPSKCKTCADTTPVQQDLTKGVVVYYKKDNRIHHFKVKKFKQLSDVLQQ